MKLAGMRGQEKVGEEEDTGAGVKAEGFFWVGNLEWFGIREGGKKRHGGDLRTKGGRHEHGGPLGEEQAQR